MNDQEKDSDNQKQLAEQGQRLEEKAREVAAKKEQLEQGEQQAKEIEFLRGMETSNLKRLVQEGLKELDERHASLSEFPLVYNRTTNGHHAQQDGDTNHSSGTSKPKKEVELDKSAKT